jgi:voltage-gated potassium channel
MYFCLTTLSTVGYGDYYPSSIMEKIVGIFIEIVGVTIFSILMNQFIEVVLRFKGDDESAIEI